MKRRLLALLTCVAGVAPIVVDFSIVHAQQDALWVAFRYDEKRVLFYFARKVDPVGQDYSNPLKPPAARYGAGGYLLPLTPQRLKTFSDAPSWPAPGDSSVVPAIGRQLTLLLGGKTSIPATVEQYVEQWGSENPVVAVGALATVPDANRSAFKATEAAYFLVGTASQPAPRRVVPQNATLPSGSQLLNQFDRLGDLVVNAGEFGWCVTLAVDQKGVRHRTPVAYCYGD
jgi:hypothetical protein